MFLRRKRVTLVRDRERKRKRTQWTLSWGKVRYLNPWREEQISLRPCGRFYYISHFKHDSINHLQSADFLFSRLPRSRPTYVNFSYSNEKTLHFLKKMPPMKMFHVTYCKCSFTHDLMWPHNQRALLTSFIIIIITYIIQCPPLILAPLINMSKGSCENNLHCLSFWSFTQ